MEGAAEATVYSFGGCRQLCCKGCALFVWILGALICSPSLHNTDAYADGDAQLKGLVLTISALCGFILLLSCASCASYDWLSPVTYQMWLVVVLITTIFHVYDNVLLRDRQYPQALKLGVAFAAQLVIFVLVLCIQRTCTRPLVEPSGQVEVSCVAPQEQSCSKVQRVIVWLQSWQGKQTLALANAISSFCMSWYYVLYEKDAYEHTDGGDTYLTLTLLASGAAALSSAYAVLAHMWCADRLPWDVNFRFVSTLKTLMFVFKLMFMHERFNCSSGNAYFSRNDGRLDPAGWPVDQFDRLDRWCRAHGGEVSDILDSIQSNTCHLPVNWQTAGSLMGMVFSAFLTLGTMFQIAVVDPRLAYCGQLRVSVALPGVVMNTYRVVVAITCAMSVSLTAAAWEFNPAEKFSLFTAFFVLGTSKMAIAEGSRHFEACSRKHHLSQEPNIQAFRLSLWNAVSVSLPTMMVMIVEAGDNISDGSAGSAASCYYATIALTAGLILAWTVLLCATRPPRQTNTDELNSVTYRLHDRQQTCNIHSRHDRAKELLMV